MLLRCCLIHINIFILRYILYLVYLCPCLGLGLFMSYISVPFFIFSLAFIAINHITSLKQAYLFFVHFLEHLLLFFFLSGVSFTDTDNSQDSRGREGTFFYSTLPLPPAHEHSDIYVHLSHIFNHNACIYQTATQ